MVARKPLSPFFCWLQWTLFLNVFIAILPSAPLVIPVGAIARLGKGTGIVEIPECPMGKTQDSPHSLSIAYRIPDFRGWGVRTSGVRTLRP
ncbi:hypothetical protein I7I53_05463 [Histoplasma capsulatum var. duboisii H88]|uniref:Uncharacterized protein n=1 Tax=Ajellomyces capsulatus (strain H88) TaxID=544711 RepID=A0A8A1LT06_AJEC8|nr:hypothetical protein I7I53_05463 [Histoplasma capsulatum var. duboisii H88]